MKLISYQDLIPTPWKNGGGVTRELACHPEGADFATFLWRVSIAEVNRSGPFSCFPGIDRSITLLSGAGMQLTFADGKTHPLIAPLVPYQFIGEAALNAQLVDAGCEDFNLMCRRGMVSGEVVVLHRGETIDASDFLLLFSARGKWEVSTAKGEVFILTPRQTFINDAGIISVRPLTEDSALMRVKINRD